MGRKKENPMPEKLYVTRRENDEGMVLDGVDAKGFNLRNLCEGDVVGLYELKSVARVSVKVLLVEP